MISRAVWILSLVSLFTDIASEMLYPVMPLYLQSIGFGIVAIGILEGIAEAIAGVGKAYFGKWSDNLGKRLPFVQWGYALSALSKPMMALSPAITWIFAARSIDRVGKGLRTGARDALLSAEATPATKGRIFGFHRSMDTLGAAIGPLLALLFLAAYPGNYQLLFYLAFFPGLVAIFVSLLLKEPALDHQSKSKYFTFQSYFSFWTKSPPLYRRLTTYLLIFGLVNSSDVFLLLKMKDAGCSDQWLIGTYVFYNAVYALAAYPLGIIADRVGLKQTLMFGLSCFIFTYSGMAFATSNLHFGGLFLLYGLYAAATEGVAKAWITNIVQRQDAGAAIGTYSGFQSIAALVASSAGGLIWFKFGSSVLFIGISIITFLVVIFISLNTTEEFNSP